MSLDVLSFLEINFDKVSPVNSDPDQYRVSPCPNCGNNNRKLYVNTDKKVFHCFVCDYGRGVRIEKLFWDVGANPRDYIIDDDVLDDIHDFPKKEPLKVIENEKRLPKEFRFLIGNNSDLGKMALNYVRKRGISDSLIQEYKMGFCYDGFYKNRIIVPYYEDEELCYFTGRDFTGAQYPKYLNSTWEKSSVLFNYERAKNNYNYVVLVEGAFDVFSLPDHSVCLLGKYVSQQQIAKLRYFKKVYIALDNDATKDAQKLAYTLQSQHDFKNLYLVKLPDGEDPSSLGDNFKHYIDTAKSYNILTPSTRMDAVADLLGGWRK